MPSRLDEFRKILESRKPDTATLLSAVEQTERAISQSGAVSWLRDYYRPEGDYAGSTFRDLPPNDPDRVTPADLFATSLLNVKIGPLAARQFVEKDADLADLLAAIPSDADLRSAEIDIWQAADSFYRAIKSALGRNPWVTASKLCARKRPDFFPVRDSVVTEIRLGIGTHWLTDWQVYRHILSDPNVLRGLAELEREVRQKASSLPLDPPLRILDVLLWMSTPKKPRRGRR